jgi:hypothetical protein
MKTELSVNPAYVDIGNSGHDYETQEVTMTLKCLPSLLGVFLQLLRGNRVIEILASALKTIVARLAGC